LLWRNLCGYGSGVATHDPTRDVQRFDAYRAALRDAVGEEPVPTSRRRTLKVSAPRRRRVTRTTK
jgi:hypothetical protein